MPASRLRAAISPFRSQVSLAIFLYSNLQADTMIGSGIQLVRYNIHSIPIPLLATVSLDGVSQTGISIPDDITEIVYSLQGFPYGDHVLRVDLLSWSSTETSHFRLDRAIISETRTETPTPPPPPPPPPPPITSSTTSPKAGPTPNPATVGAVTTK